jgi:PKD repeat protein
MKLRGLFAILLTVLLLLGFLTVVAAADEPTTVVDPEGALLASGPAEPDSQAGIDVVAAQYTFSSFSGTYTEIVSGTVHGTNANDDQSFTPIDLGFTFRYNNIDYTQISIQSNGWIAMGPTIGSSYYPLSTGAYNNVIAALARDLQGNSTDSELRSLTEGTAPNRVFTVQWKHYKRYGTSYVGDDFNFQIKLYETSGLVEVVYGPFTVLYVASPPYGPQVGLRGNSNADFNNRTMDASQSWATSVAGTTNADSMTLTDLIYPASGLTYDWSLATGLFLDPVAQSGGACPGSDVSYDFAAINQTGVAQGFNLAYTSVWTASGPASTGVIANNGSETIAATVHIPWAAATGDSDVLTVDAADATNTYTATATATTMASLASGYTDYANVPVGREVRAPGVVYYDGKLYKIGGYGYVSGTGAARAWLDIYDIATNTWTSGPDMPGARYWIDCEEIGTGTDAKIYCAGGYLSSAQSTLYIYDITTNTWTTGSALPAARYSYASVKLGGKYYVIGGYTTAYQATMLVYDPATGLWDSTLASMNTSRRYFHAGVIGGKIYVAGGYGSSPVSYLSSAEVYDPGTNTWTYVASMPSPWLNAADGVKHDRFLVLTGGTWNSTSGASNGALMYDAQLNQWSWLPLLDRFLYSAEGDGDGTQFWTVSGRMYDGATWSNSPYTTLLDQCEACTPVSGADFSVDPSTPRPNMPATFAGSVAGGSPAITWEWSFGDGTYGSGQVVDHTYTAVNTYTVVMTATNCDGTSLATATKQVVVMAGSLAVISPLALEATQCPDSQTEQEISICNEGDQPLTWTLTETLGILRGARSSVESLSGSYVAFDPSAGGATCYVPDMAQTFCFRAESYTTDFEYRYAEWLKFPADWTVSNVYMVGTPVCDSGALWGSFSWTFETSPYEFQVDHPVTNAPVDHCVATYCVDVTPGGGGGGGGVSWYYDGDGFNFAPHHPCSSDVYTPASMAAEPCDEWVNPQATVPICEDLSPVPWLYEDPLSGTVEPGTCETVTVIFDSTDLEPGLYTAELQIETNDILNPSFDIPVALTVAGPPTDADFTYTPPQPWMNQGVTFNGAATALLPVDYAWDFGDGATGAGQNPTHAYAVAGTYTVIMTATQCGFSVTVTDTVTVVPCWSLVTENFEGTFPPANWTVTNNGGTCVWQRNDAFATARPNYAGSGFCADADSDKCGSGTTMDTELRTMVLDLSTATTATLNYVTAYNDIGTGGDYADVDASIDGGTTWTNLLRWDEDHGAYGPGEAVTLDLTQFQGEPSVIIRFHYWIGTYDWWWEVDQVQVGACYVAGAAPDIAVDPTSLTQTLGVNQTAVQTFNIANVDLGILDWTLDEGCGTPVDWLSESPTSGTLHAYHDTDVEATFDSAGLALGTYQTTICVNSNDPDEATVLVDVTLIVTGTPDIAVTPPSLETTLCQGETEVMTLTICNEGTGPLVWSLSEVPAGLAAIPAATGVALPVEAVSIPQGPASPAIADSGVSSGTPVVGAPANPIRPDDIGDAWEVMAPLPSARVFNAVVAAGPYIYVIGGTSDAGGLTPTNTNYRYNTGDNTWSTMTPMPAALDSIDGIAIGGVIYIPGSDPDNNTYVYNTATDTWSAIPANGGYAAPAQYQVVAIGTDLYVLGGIIGGASTPNVWVLNTTTGTWSAGVPMQNSRTSFSAAAIGGNIYVAGGVAYPGFVPDMTAEMFNGTTWNYIAPVPNGGGAYTRWSYNADGMAPGALWLGAGRRDAGWAVLNHAGYYDVATDTWTDSPTIPVLNQGRVYMEGDVGSDGYFYVIGGRDSAGAIAYATNERLMVYSQAVDIPWLTEVPTNSVLLPGECISVAVTFDSDALPAGVYSGDLLIESNDPDEPQVTIPVQMTVLAAPSGADFLWSPLEPLIGQTAYFSGTVAGGSAPLTWSWTFGDGGTATGQYATHIYAVPGDYLVTLTVANTCGQVVVEHTVTVIGEADIIVTPSSLAATLCPDATTTMTVTICNEGDIPLDWALSEAPAVKLGGLAPAVAGGQTRKVELSLQGVPAKAKATSPWQPDGLVNLVLDDGTAESFIGLNDGTYGYQFLWLNRFTPSPADYPFNLTQIAVLLGATNVPLGGAVDLVAYQDTDGDGDPSNAVWLATYHVTIQANDGATWSVYNLATPVTLSGPGDVLIGVINRYEESGVDLKDYPAGIDRTAPSQQRSWIGAWNLDPPDPALLPPDADGMWDLIDNFGLAGNWMVRGGGETIYDIPWLSEDPTSGTVPPGECVDVAVTFDSTGMAAGVYNGNLVISSNDPDTPQVTIPVEMTVLEPATIVDVTYTVTGLQVAFDATATGAAPLTFAWTFGDGGTSNLEDPTHVYAGNGCYPVTLTVSNACGEDIWTGEVCISYYHYYYLPIISRNYTP